MTGRIILSRRIPGSLVAKLHEDHRRQRPYTMCCVYARAGVVMGANGKLYGTTIGGGALGLGAAFEVTPQTLYLRWWIACLTA
jgi:uncharacterized repeat protein (TIGR03803 family)